MFAKIKKALKKAETFNQTPKAAPIGWKRPPTLQETIQRHMAHAQLLAAQSGAESFEEAEDFDVEDSDDVADFSSPWETDFDHATGQVMYKNQKAFLDNERKTFDAYVTEHKKSKRSKFQEEKPDKKKKSLEEES